MNKVQLKVLRSLHL